MVNSCKWDLFLRGVGRYHKQPLEKQSMRSSHHEYCSICIVLCINSSQQERTHNLHRALEEPLTTWMSSLLFRSWTEARDFRKGNMTGLVLAQQLISSRTLTRFSYATRLSCVSMSAQYLHRAPHAQHESHQPHRFHIFSKSKFQTFLNFPGLIFS